MELYTIYYHADALAGRLIRPRPMLTTSDLQAARAAFASARKAGRAPSMRRESDNALFLPDGTWGMAQ